MKKFSKFIFATLSVAAFAGGAYYFVKNILNKNTSDDFDDFEDDFDDFDLEEGDDCDPAKEDRGYVTLNFQEEETKEAETESTSTPVQEEPVESAPADESNTTEQ